MKYMDSDSADTRSRFKERRRFLEALGSVGVAGVLAGCTGDTDDGANTDETDTDGTGTETDTDGTSTDTDGSEDPASIVIAEVDHDDERVLAVGDELTVKAILENEGDVSGSATVTLSIGDAERDSEDVDLDGGQQIMSILSGDTSDFDPGEHDLEVATDEDSWTGTVEFESGIIYEASDEARYIDVSRTADEGGGLVAKWVYEFAPDYPSSIGSFDPPESYGTPKPFLMLYDPETENPLTSWPSPDMDDAGGYTSGWYHHRGVYIGWGGIDVELPDEEITIDNWHDEVTRVEGHDPPVGEFGETGRLGSTVAWYDWSTHDNEEWDPATATRLADEHREFRFREPPEDDDVIISFDMVSTVEAHFPMRVTGGGDWDAEHASHQIRTYIDSDINDDLAYYYSDHYDYGEEQSHESDNDPPLDGRYQDILWIAGETELHGETYHFVWMTHPDNPSQGDPDNPTIWSANRDYGRFGHYWVDEWDAGDVTPCVYRIVVVKDTFDQNDYERVETWYDAFLDDVEEDGDIL
jgi:hypothetical protein